MRARGTDPAIERARQAVGVVFAVGGLIYASFISRAPAIRDELDLSSGGLGLLLVCWSIGSVVALPLSGIIVGRVGPVRTISVSALVIAAAYTVTALALATGSVLLAGPSLMVAGVAVSLTDVAMNVEGADVERRLERVLMPRFHAGFSLGTVLGAGIGAACAAAGVGVAEQLFAVQVATCGVVLLAARRLVGVRPAPEEAAARPSVGTAWRERRTLLIGLMVFCFALAEGIANDWLAIAVVDGYGGSPSAGAATFALFVAAMTFGRVVGGGVLERLGRTLVLRGLAVAVVGGVTVVMLAPSAGWAAAGAVLWGLGASLGFPVGMSAAADEERMSTVRVSVVSSIAYTAFFGGPPLVGLLADEFGILDALLVVPVAMALALLAIPATRRPAPVEAAAEAEAEAAA